MKILVLGGSGFIGSNFILNQINEHENTIHNYDKLTYAGNPDNLINLENDPRYEFINDDICNKNCIIGCNLVSNNFNIFLVKFKIDFFIFDFFY